jgi:hypothetical protein
MNLTGVTAYECKSKKQIPTLFLALYVISS